MRSCASPRPGAQCAWTAAGGARPGRIAGEGNMTTFVSKAASVLPEPERRVVRAPRGPQRSCSTWQAEAAMRLLMNNLDPEVAEDPARLVVYGGRGQAARSWAAFDAIVRCLRQLAPDETLLVQSGK